MTETPCGEILRRIDENILTAVAAWEESKRLSRLSSSKGRRFGDAFFLGDAGGLRTARIIVCDVLHRPAPRRTAAGRIFGRKKQGEKPHG